MYGIGLDIGITSVGWTVLELNNKGEPIRINDFGSRIFDAAEVPKTGASLALPRREARGARRRNRRHRHRMERIKALICRKGIIAKAELEGLYSGKDLKDIYEIRYDALDEKLKDEEFARLLIHLAQRRGFKSNRKADSAEKEAGKLLTAVGENRRLMEEKNYRTIGEMIYKDDKFLERKRNKSEDYSNTFDRGMLIDEIKYIFAAQRNVENLKATEELENEYIQIYGSQRSFEEGPGGESKYGGNQIEKMIGKCTFIPEEPRAAKASFTFEYFTLLTNINNMRIRLDANKRPLTEEERDKLIKLAFKTKDLTYKKIRKELKLDESEFFGTLSYGSKSAEDVEKAKFEYLKAYHAMRIAFDKIEKGYILELEKSKKDTIGYAFTVFKTDKKIQDYLLAEGFDNKEIQTLIDNMPGFNKFGSLSLLAMDKILPYLEQRLKYNEACEKAGYDFKAHNNKGKHNLLPPLPNDIYEITSPVVKRAISQSIKVVNSLIRKYGQPAKINIELAREMSKNFSDRKKIEKLQEENFAKNEMAKQQLKADFGVEIPRGLEVLKYKLWKEQDGICAYTGTPLRIEQLFETGYCEVDHIIPYSISFDDSYKNKVLVTTYANREKGNRLPLQYIQDKERFIVWVKTQIRDRDKKNKLLKESFSEEEQEGMKNRNLQDTQHITSFFANYLRNNLIFDENLDKKERVVSVNGRVTAYMRRRWGINKVRENGDLHHAVDALVVACITPGIIQKVSRYIKYKEEEYITNKETGEVIDKRYFPSPWEEFSRELDIRLGLHPIESLLRTPLPNYEGVDINSTVKRPFVSRMKVERGKGQAHQETIRGKVEENGGLYVVTKTSLKKLKLDKDGEIANYYDKNSDLLLYEKLRNQLLEYGGDGEKAFKEPFYKPTPKGGNAPQVKSVKIMEKMGLGVDINSGIAANGSMVRIDVFHVENEGYYFVPIYVSDLVKDKLPNKASVANKPVSNWKEMDEKDFIFSLCKNDLIKITSKRGISFTRTNDDNNKPKAWETKEALAYYIKAGISTATITIINDDNTYTIASLGIKNLIKLEKYSVDVLGNYQKVGKETRKQNKR